MRRFSALALRGRHLVVLDIAATAGSFVLSLALRFDAPSALFDQYLSAYAWLLPLLLALRIGSFLRLRLYQRIWRYASIEELVAVTAAVAGSSVLAYSIAFVWVTNFWPDSAPGFPRSLPVIDTVLTLAFAGMWRFALRIGGIHRAGPGGSRSGEPALVVGSGSAALALIREVRGNDALGLRAVGVLAEDLPQGQRMLGLPVLGGPGDLTAAIKRERIKVVLLALPSAEGRVLRRLVREAEAAGARCLTVPGVAEVVAGRVRIDALRQIDVDDLLRRAPARIDLDSVSESFRGRTILITGAGGSIGSELTRQVLAFEPREVILLGRGENSIFEALLTLRPKTSTQITPVIMDVRDRTRLRQLVLNSRPDVIFHAAAHKHVHFMEMYPEEAVLTNIFGTTNVIEAAEAVEVERFVHISTDKAVNPESVMGVTKRVSELLIAEAAERSRLRFANVRFGNVLSSRGSVVPIFKRQLEAGGPITITHPDVARYFMTIPEAVQLVLQASVLARPGDTFVLDMGERVRIVDLANDLLELHGLRAGEDIDIQYIGLRPGEKLLEELLFPYERAESTTHEAIRRVVSMRPAPAPMSPTLSTLIDLQGPSDRPEIVHTLRRLIPEYRPGGSGDAVAVET